MNSVIRCVAFALALTASGCSFLKDHQNAGSGKGSGFFFQEENDSIAPGNRDKSYTQGLRWAKAINPAWNEPRFQAAKDAVDVKLCKVLRCTQLPHQVLWSTGIAQTMFTPDDITKEEPQPFDRPWVGFLYLDNTLRLTDTRTDARHQHVIELQTGVIGSASGARWAQSALHALIGSPHPIPGWQNQLSRPGLELIYLRNWRFARKYAELQPFVGGAAGTTMVYGNGGAYLRIGKNITKFFNTGPMQANLAGGDNNERPKWEYWVYAGYDARLVPYNFFLSKGDIDVEKRVSDRLLGASVRLYSYRLTYNHVRRSKEFSHPLGPQYPNHTFGSVMLSYELIIP